MVFLSGRHAILSTTTWADDTNSNKILYIFKQLAWKAYVEFLQDEDYGLFDTLFETIHTIVITFY